MGLGQVRDLRRSAVKAIIAERARGPFVRRRSAEPVELQAKEAMHLIQCGALDGLGGIRPNMLAEARSCDDRCAQRPVSPLPFSWRCRSRKPVTYRAFRRSAAAIRSRLSLESRTAAVWHRIQFSRSSCPILGLGDAYPRPARQRAGGSPRSRRRPPAGAFAPAPAAGAARPARDDRRSATARLDRRSGLLPVRR